MTSARPQVTAGPPDSAGHAAMPGPLPVRRRSVQAASSPLPQRQPDSSAWTAADPEVLEKVRAALRQM